MDVDWDNLSVTSTLDEVENSEEEFTAEGIIAEGSIEGETRYLVEWTGYPLHQATWEPTSHLNDALLGDWAEQKAKVSRKEAKAFKIREWRKAAEMAIFEKHDRHLMRNELRISRDEVPTEWEFSLEERLQYVKDFSPKDPPATSLRTLRTIFSTLSGLAIRQLRSRLVFAVPRRLLLLL